MAALWRRLTWPLWILLGLRGSVGEGQPETRPGARPCQDVLAGVAVTIGDSVGRLLNQFHSVLDPQVTAMPEKLLLFLGWDLVDVTLGLMEEAYQSACDLLGCGSCSLEHFPFPKKAKVSSRLGERFEDLANRLWVFLELFQRLGRLPEEEGSPSALAPWADHHAALRRFAAEAPSGGVLVALGQLLPKLRRANSEDLLLQNWCTELVAALLPVRGNVTMALKLSSAMMMEYRRRPLLWHSFDVSGYLAYFEGAIQHYWFSDVLSFIHNFARGTPRSELLFSRNSSICGTPSVRLHSHHSAEARQDVRTTPLGGPYADATGFLSWHGQSLRSLLEQISGVGHPLSRTFWTARPRNSFELRCNTSVEVLYDPTTCLQEQGWAGYVYVESANPNRDDVPQCEYYPRPWQGQSVKKSTWIIYSMREKVTAPPEGVDVLVMSPLIGNCLLMKEMLRAESMTIAKLVYVPFNPTLPPPLVVRPNFTAFAVKLWERSAEEPELVSSPSLLGKHATMAQCSLAAVAEVLAPLSYRLLQVEHQFAVFVHDTFASVFGLDPGHQPSRLYEEWRLGWFCSPLSRYMFGLEAAAKVDFDEVLPESSGSAVAQRRACLFLASQGFDTPDAMEAHNCSAVTGPAAPEPAEAAAQPEPGALKPAVERLRRELWSREQSSPGPGQSHLLRAGDRSTCIAGGPCDCLVPYRGPMCRAEDRSPLDEARPYRAAIHYIVNEAEEHLVEFMYTLENLWTAFNAQKDYPVLVFHDGLSTETRRKIMVRAPHRVWFFRVDDWVPPDSGADRKMHSKFGLGYMAQSRFRSGPLFEHPAVKDFDYLWTLDTDSHFPEPVKTDPLEQLHRNPELVMGFSYMTRTSAASVRGLWEHTILYAMRENIDIWGDLLHSNWHAGKSHFMANFLLSRTRGYERLPFWNNQVMMTDCEVLRLSFFRGRSSRYWDYYSYLDSMQGFWSDRWGDHAVRTLGVGMALWEQDRGGWEAGKSKPDAIHLHRVFQMDPPYAHQDHCECRSEARVCQAVHDPQAGLRHEQLKPLRKKFWTCVPAASEGE